MNRRVFQTTDHLGADCTLLDRECKPHRAVIGVGKTSGEAMAQALDKWLSPDSYLVLVGESERALRYQVPTASGIREFEHREACRLFLLDLEGL